MSQRKISSIQEFKHQGITFLLAEDHSIANFTLGVAFTTGHADDPIELDGLSQFVVEMMLRGTEKYDRENLHAKLEQLGCNVNSAASSTHMGVIGETLSRYADEFTSILGEILKKPTFPEDELAQLKKEARDHLENSINDDATLGRRHFRKLIYHDHPYGRAGEGTFESIDKITIAAMKKRYQEFCATDDAIIYAAGDLTRDQLTKLADTHLLPLQPGGNTTSNLGAPEPLHGHHLVIVDKPDRSQVQLFMGHRSVPANHEDVYALEAASAAFGGFFNSRYTHEIRVKNGWTYSAASQLALSRDAGAFLLRTFTSEKNLDKVVHKSLEMLTELREKGLTPDELDRAKSHLTRRYPFKFDTADKRVQQALRIKLYDLPEDYYDTYCQRISSLSQKDVLDVLRRQIDSENVGVLAVAQSSSAREYLERGIDSLASVSVVPYDKL